MYCCHVRNNTLKKKKSKPHNYMSLAMVPGTSVQSFVLSPVLLVRNSAEVFSAACLSSPHPLVKVVLYPTSSLSEATFWITTFCAIYFPFKLRTFIFLSFLLACLHPLQNCLLSSSSILYLYKWGMSSVSSFYVFTLLPFGATNPKPTGDGCLLMHVPLTSVFEMSFPVMEILF